MPFDPKTRTRLGPAASGVAALLLALIMLLQSAAAQSATPAASPAASPVAIADPLHAATAWLEKQELAGGSFAGYSGTADLDTTTDAVVALAAAAEHGETVDLNDPLNYLYANGGDFAKKGPGQAAKLVLAILAAGGETSKVAGGDPFNLLTAAQPGANGLYGAGVYDHAYVILALAAAGQTVPQAAFDALAKTQLTDGSWGFDGKTTAGNGDTNTTSIVIQALVAAKHGDDPAIAKGLAYLKTTQTADGGFPYQPGSASDANSTALVVQAILTAGQNPAAADWNNAAGALEAFQNADGAFRYQNAPPDDNLFSTVQAIPAIEGQPLPVIAHGSDTATPAAATPAA